jgi:hypothetical protein
MLKIYLSSTFEDLKEHREAVYRQLNKLAGLKVIAMEDYVATDERPLAKCLSDVADCDIYIGLFAWRYGFIPQDLAAEGRSITECEYRYAEKLEKTCLIFLVDEKEPWVPAYMDSATNRPEAAAKLAALRKELLDSKTAVMFGTPQEVASAAAVAVANQLARLQPAAATGAHDAGNAPQFREITGRLLIACSPHDEVLATALAQRVSAASGRSAAVAPRALFAKTQEDFAELEAALTVHHAGLVLATATSKLPLLERTPQVERILSIMEARLGEVALVLGGVTADELPPGLCRIPCFVLPGHDEAALTAAAFADAANWARQVVPPPGMRAVGLPVSVVAMTKEELLGLQGNAGLIGDQLGRSIQEQFECLTGELNKSGIAWTDAYGATREVWQPFGVDGKPVRQLIAGLVHILNSRNLPKLRERQIKVQWYPFDHDLLEEPNLRGIYQDVAKGGCVLLVDEMSLFYPPLREALINSPFFNNEQVAVVTISPLDSGQDTLNKLLEAAARKNLSWAFERYATDLDPQCEFAVSDERRLKRWLHASIPETASNMRDPRPDRPRMQAFFDKVGVTSRRGGGDYLWGGGGRP